MAGTVSEIEAVVVAAITLTAVVTRPRGLNEGVAALGGAVLVAVTQAEEEQAAETLQGAVSDLQPVGASAERMRTVSLRGRPNEALRDLAEAESAVLVVGGPAGLAGPHSLGKTARFLIDHAPIAAILIR